MISINEQLTQYCYPQEEPDQGFFVREQLCEEISKGINLKSIINSKDYLYDIDCKLTQYCYPQEEPDQGLIVREQLCEEIRVAAIYNHLRALSKMNQIEMNSYLKNI